MHFVSLIISISFCVISFDLSTATVVEESLNAFMGLCPGASFVQHVADREDQSLLNTYPCHTAAAFFSRFIYAAGCEAGVKPVKRESHVAQTDVCEH
jgi:hypothetical protein